MNGNQIGNQIKQLRIARNITQEELLVKIARLFHVSTDNLLGCSTEYSLDITGLTLKQQSTLQEIIQAYHAYNQMNPDDDHA